jgi:predicted amidohydrolase YtcJ
MSTSSRAEVVLHNANILTQDPNLPRARSVRVRENRIDEVSETDLPVGNAEVLDLQGATVLPGFHDVHAHSVWFGLTKLELDLGTIDSIDQVYDLIASHAASLEPDDWVIAAGFAHQRTDGKLPDRDLLDRASGRRPVWIKHRSGHAASVNGVALALMAGRADLSSPIEGGLVARDAAGQPTGLLEEQAMSLVQQLHLPYPVDTLTRALGLATEHYLTEGITSVTDAGIGGGWIGHSPREIAAYQLARSRGILHTRMQPMFVIDALHPIAGHESESQVLGLGGGMYTGFGDDRLRLGPVKIFSDGSLLGATAAVSEEYVGCPGNHGYLQESAHSLRDRALQAYAAGWAIAMHAIGDAAVDQAISIIGEAQRRYGFNAAPNRIEHAGIVRDDQLAHIAELKIAVTPQPRFLYEFGDSMLERVGPNRESHLYRARSFLDHGIILPGSSDRPVADGNVLGALQSFVERRTSRGTIIGAGERLTVVEALRAYTLGSAEATGQSDQLGSVTPGKLADLVVLGDDPLTTPTDRLADVGVVATMVDGVFVYGSDRIR